MICFDGTQPVDRDDDQNYWFDVFIVPVFNTSKQTCFRPKQMNRNSEERKLPVLLVHENRLKKIILYTVITTYNCKLQLPAAH